MVWVRRSLVALALAAPVVVVVLVARPDASSAPRRESRPDGSGPGGAIVAGDEVTAELRIGEVHAYDLAGDGSLTVRVRGVPPFDGTLTVVDGDGDRVDYNDDTDGLDPMVQVDLDDGDGTVVEVRELSGSPGRYTLAAE